MKLTGLPITVSRDIILPELLLRGSFLAERLFKWVKHCLVLYVSTHLCQFDCLKWTLVTAFQISSTRVSNTINVHKKHIFTPSFWNRGIIAGMMPYELQLWIGNNSFWKISINTCLCSCFLPLMISLQNTLIVSIDCYIPTATFDGICVAQ